LGLGVITALSAEEVKTFEQLDADSDGYISKEEAKADTSINRNWTKADKDKNGRLDTSEFSAFEASGYVPPHDREEAEPGAAPLD
jgi:Ca2+-binding EF-hand superfamily protein